MSNISRLMIFLRHFLTALPGRSSEQQLCSAPWQHCCPELAHTSSGQFLGSLLSDHSAQLLHVAVADVTILSLFHFDSLGAWSARDTE